MTLPCPIRSLQGQVVLARHPPKQRRVLAWRLDH